MTTQPSAILRELIWAYRDTMCTCSFKPRFVCKVHGPGGAERLLIAEATANRIEADEKRGAHV